MQIKNVNRKDILKFILHGCKDDQGKKAKNISISTLAKAISKRVGFGVEVANELARYLIESPDENGKVMKQDDHDNACKLLRKDLQAKLLSKVPDYSLYNGVAITSLLNRLQQIFESKCIEIETDLEDKDMEDKGVLKLSEIYHVMKLNQIMVGTFDDEIKEFIQYLAMRHSKSLDEVDYKKLINAFGEEFNIVDDEQSIWATKDAKGNLVLNYEPSSEEGELDSET